MDLVDAEAQLDTLIERRARKGEQDPDELEPGYAESVRRFHERRRRENRALWYAWHIDQAERLEQTAAELAARHRRKAQRLNEPEGASCSLELVND
ncbi:MAG: hypothetical protein LC781_05160 [Actinobacteria bacterium]|nr:hypothetical protein [Actinomycetota bacterium]